MAEKGNVWSTHGSNINSQAYLDGRHNLSSHSWVGTDFNKSHPSRDNRLRNANNFPNTTKVTWEKSTTTKPHERSEHGQWSGVRATSTEQHDYNKPITLRLLINFLEDFGSLNLNEAKSLYLELMRKSDRSDELEREEKYFEEKKKREAHFVINDGYDQTEVDEQRKRTKEFQEENKILKTKVEDLMKGMVQIQQKCESTKIQLEGDISLAQTELQRSKEELKVALREKNEALTRLSREMGTKLNDNNPAIADLSDPNRATKIAEKYNELYDNQWTDAMEELYVYEEKESIKKLLDILKECYQTCEETAAKQLESLQVILRTPTAHVNQGIQSSPSKVDDRIRKTTNKMLKDCRKLMAEEPVEDIAENLVKRHSGSVNANFLKKCVELCWLMAVQDPPVVLGKEAQYGEKFDSDKYREYTSTGSVVEYTVWLPLVLHKNGPLLCKGVAQPVQKSKPTKRTTPVPKPLETQHYKQEELSKPNIHVHADITHDQFSHDATRGHHGHNIDTGRSDRNHSTELVQHRYDQTKHAYMYQRQEPRDFRSNTYGISNFTKQQREEPNHYGVYNKKPDVFVDIYGERHIYYVFECDGNRWVDYKNQLYPYHLFKSKFRL